MNKTDDITIQTLLQDFQPRVCAFSYVAADNTPVVCHMGFALHENTIILHTNTWTHKWQTLKDDQKVAMAIGLNHLNNYSQVFGRVYKMEPSAPCFSKLENIYLGSHPDSMPYRNKEGLLLIRASTVRIAKVRGVQPDFEDYRFD
jgi:Pyridoxamine 5'-phosphate oxidase